MQALTKKVGISVLIGMWIAGSGGALGHAAGHDTNTRIVNGTLVSTEGKIGGIAEEGNADIKDAAQVQVRVDKGKQQIANIEQRFKEVKRQFLDVPYASIENKLMLAKSALAASEWKDEQRSEKERGEKLAELEGWIQEAYYLSLESRIVEIRGVWVQPTESSIEQVRDHLQKIKSAHLNAVYLASGASHSFGETMQSTMLKKQAAFDPVQAYVEEGAKLGLAVLTADNKERDRMMKNGGSGKLGAALTDHPVWNVDLIEIGKNAGPVEQLVQKRRALHTAGFVIVDEQSFFNGTVKWQWWMGVYRSPAFLPDYRSAQPVALLLEQISRKIRTIYLPLQGIEGEAANRYMKWIDQMSTIVRQVKQWDKNSVQSVREVLNNLMEEISRDRDIGEGAKMKLSFDIEEGIALIDAFMTQ
ncbi:hypothetical protein AZ66_09395 [Paenibacillus sp. E194]|uniref:hypothetical protein n=1 Tax=Paenibacillus sp. E194 TaxID=1458845 RepID=UPI0005C8BE91|nr:hypothetical protein [Paenibacillus sp. E194]KJB88073.1 hypothetical protein AZ66_09395 [Paenibacillus sp. E194]